MSQTDYKPIKRNWVYDLETLYDFFCGVFKYEEDIRVFEISYRRNDLPELIHFLKTEVLGLKGYNNISFDSQIIQYIWYNQNNVTANEIHRFANKVINNKWAIYKEQDLIIPNLDIYKILHLDNKNRMVGLKWCQYMLDWNNVEDMPINHNNAVADHDQANLIIQYCINDVTSTEHIFNKYPKEIELRVKLSEKYGINFMNASNSKIGSELMLKMYCERTNRNPNQVRTMRTERSSINCNTLIFPIVKFDCEPFQRVLEAYNKLVLKPQEEKEQEKKNQKKKHVISVIHNNFKFDYGLGGVHGSLENSIVVADEGWLIIDADVALKWRN